MLRKVEARNKDVREVIEQSGLHYWQIAEQMQIRPDKFSVLLRYKLSDEAVAAIYEAIKVLKEG